MLSKNPWVHVYPRNPRRLRPCPVILNYVNLKTPFYFQAGGFVEFNRVNGNLALSRAFGDFAFKNNIELPPDRQMISSKPDVVVREVGEDLMFVVLACDGIWDVLSNQEVADFVISKLAAGMEPEIICEELMTRCLAPDSSMGGLGCDNMTVILVCFLHNQTYDK